MTHWLKADLHVHTREDVIDHNIITYTAPDLITIAKDRGFDVLAVTNHLKPTLTSEVINNAADQGLIFLPGVEASIKGRHIVIISPRLPVPVPRSYADLQAVKNDGYLVLAPHPFYPPPSSLRGHLERNITAFNAIEFSHFYTTWSNPNRKAVELAEKYQLPLVGTSDMHYLRQMDHTFTMINAARDPEAIIQAVKQNKIKLQTTPLTSTHYVVRGTIKAVKTLCYDIPRAYFIRRTIR